MPEADTGQEAKNFHIDIPPRSTPFTLKGCHSLDWGLQNRLARIFNPDSERTVMLAIDHG